LIDSLYRHPLALCWMDDRGCVPHHRPLRRGFFVQNCRLHKSPLTERLFVQSQETGLGAAAHMGRHGIAQFLLAHGARMDIFAAAMLGHLAVVQAMLVVNPEARNLLGPHGIPLVKHAEAGGERAAVIADYLEGLGAGR